MTSLMTYTRDVKMRLAEVLQARLPDTIAANSPVGLTLPVPALTDYWMPGTHLPDALISSPIAVVIRQTERPFFENPASGDGVTDCITATLPMEVRILFSEDVMGTINLELFGRTMDRSEYYTEVAQAYAGAIIQAVYESAQDGKTIDLVNLTNTFPTSTQYREGLRAVALTEWEVTRIVSRPLDTRYTQPASALITR